MMKNANVVLTSFPHDPDAKHVDVKPLWLKQRRLTPGRFRKLAKFLSDLPAKHFCMKTWVTGAEVPRQTCGTTACIAGWATTMDFAKKRAVKLFTQKFKYTGYGELPGRAPRRAPRYTSLPPSALGWGYVDIYTSLPPSALGWKTKEPVLTFYSALEMFFGLTGEEIQEIFFDTDLSKKDAINLLRKKAKLIESEPVPPMRQVYMRPIT